MNKYILSVLSILIISFYSLILLLSIDGFQRNSKINNLLNELPSFFTPIYSFIFFIYYNDNIKCNSIFSI
ncbi:hypothetical protein BN1805_04091 [Proteus vulgaris]|nr:hypothetical protein BN1805_04091 [Proteus vulgaris]